MIVLHLYLEINQKFLQVDLRSATSIDNLRYLIQEYIEGKNLAQELAEKGVFTEAKIRELLNDLFSYPNPVYDYTRFVFEHNRPDDLLDIRIDIFSLNGQLIKTISDIELATGFRNESITWHIDENVNPGIYIYRLLVKSKNDNSIAEKTEKLIIVR